MIKNLQTIHVSCSLKHTAVLCSLLFHHIFVYGRGSAEDTMTLNILFSCIQLVLCASAIIR